METSGIVARDSNGLILKVKDLIILTGEEPKHPVVCYTTEMILMLNNKKQYAIDEIHKSKHNYKFVINLNGWNWDCRNITKIIKGDNIVKISAPKNVQS